MSAEQQHVQFTDRPDVEDVFSNDFVSLEIREGVMMLTFGVRRVALGRTAPDGKALTQRTVVARLALTPSAVTDMLRQFSAVQTEIANRSAQKQG
jgi:hypothetical protein